MPRVFISYRRSDSESEAGRLFDYLERELGPRNVFKDVDSIAAGADFRDVISDYIKRSDTLLLMMGKDWAQVRDHQGQRRIEQSGDFVRMEVASALKQGVRVVPVLIRDANMPSATELPDDIAQLVYRNSVRLRPDPDFRSDCTRLIAELTHRPKKQSTSILPTVLTAGIAAGIAVATVFVWQRRNVGGSVETLTPDPVASISSAPALTQEELRRLSAPAPAAEPVVFAPPPADGPADEPLLAAGKRLLSHLDVLNFPGAVREPWPSDGVRLAYNRLPNYASYAALLKLSPYPVFVSGPHGDQHMDFYASAEFGHYNPQFVRWFHDQLRTLLRDHTHLAATRELFRDYLGNTALAFRDTYNALHEQPREFVEIMTDYRSRIAAEDLPPYFFSDLAGSDTYAFRAKIDATYGAALVNPAVYFWVRRRIDGTDDEIFAMLEEILQAYDVSPR